VQRGFFESLFDLSFTSFVTTRLMKVLYVARLALLGGSYFVGGLLFLLVGGPVLGAAWVFVFGPVFLFAQVLTFRVTCELMVVAFCIFENTRDQLAITRAAWAPAVDAARPGGGQPPLAPPV
jgi:Domain of unknown function (DUF4282)